MCALSNAACEKMSEETSGETRSDSSDETCKETGGRRGGPGSGQANSGDGGCILPAKVPSLEPSQNRPEMTLTTCGPGSGAR
jgi:hypothetical protein